MKKFKTAIFYFTFIALTLNIIALRVFSMLDFEYAFLLISAVIAILYFLIYKLYYKRTEESDPLLNSLGLLIIAWLISFMTILLVLCLFD
jgi:membrane protein implicated in regulation of membrane protease activity